MASRRPGPGELLAGASGLALLLAMLLPWFGVEASLTLPGDAEPVVVAEAGRNAWESFAVIDVALAAAAVLALALVTRATVSPPPAALVLAVAGAAALAAVLVVYRLIEIPEIRVEESSQTAYATTRRLGAFFGLLCTAGIAWGANLALAGTAEEAEAGAERAAVEPEPEWEPEPVAAELAPEPEPEPAAPDPVAAELAPEPEPIAAVPDEPEPPPAPLAAAPAPPPPAPAPGAGPLGGWTRSAIEAECDSAWRRYDRRLGARYAEYFDRHPDLRGRQRTAARDLQAALPPGWEGPAEAVPTGGWNPRHLSAKSSETLAVALLGVAARLDPSLAWLWEALEPLPEREAEAPAIEFRHVVAPELLGERPRQTGIDVLVDDPSVLIGVATKWREPGIGACLCRGTGVGPLEGRCSPRVERRTAYWDAAAECLGLGAREPAGACPISPAYEAVRQAAALRALAGPHRPALLALLYDADNPYFTAAGDWPGWPDLLGTAADENADPEVFRFEAISWQELMPLMPLDERTLAWAADKHGLG
jgi:hypothetical protein